MAEYIIKGKIQDHDESKLYVEILDNDQNWFDDRVDDLLGSSWTDDSGKFEIKFDDHFTKIVGLKASQNCF